MPCGPGCAHRARGTAGAPAVPRLDARRSTARKQDLGQGPEGGEGRRAGAAGAGARPASEASSGGAGAAAAAGGTRASELFSPAAGSLPPNPGEPPAGGFLSNTLSYKLRQEEDAAAARRLPGPEKCPEPGVSPRLRGPGWEGAGAGGEVTRRRPGRGECPGGGGSPRRGGAGWEGAGVPCPGGWATYVLAARETCPRLVLGAPKCICMHLSVGGG